MVDWIPCTYVNKSLIESPKCIRFIVSAKSGATESTVILSMSLSAGTSTVFVVTISFTGDFFIFSIAEPQNNPCVQATRILFTPRSIILSIAASSEVPLLISSSNIMTSLSSISQIKALISTSVSLIRCLSITAMDRSSLSAW